MINQTILQGRLTRDPELRQTGTGVAVASFTVAWSEKYKDNETKLFLNCTAWRGTGEFVSKYFRKGQEIAVEGQLSTREYTDKEGGKRSVIELTADKVHFCGSKQDSGPTAQLADPTADFTEVDVDGDLPF